MASEAAATALRGGGNAVDAALSAAAVLTVVYPHQCSMGGDMVALMGLPDGSVRCINGSGGAPRQVDPQVISDRYGAMPVRGPDTVTVPGVLAGWATMAERWGSRPLGDALEVARQLAKGGFPVAPGLARDLARQADELVTDPGMKEVFFRAGRPVRSGENLKLPALAATLARLRDDGVAAFYDGPIGARVVATLREMDSAMSLADFRSHRTRVQDPLVARFRGHDYFSSPPNSQGAFFLAGLRVLAALEGRVGRRLDPGGPDAGWVAEVFSALAWERDRLLGDPSDADRPVAAILSAGYAADFAWRVERARTAGGAMTSQWPSRSQSSNSASGDTVAIVTTDRWGHWVCVIQSMFHAFGSGILDPETGLGLHNRGASFSLDSTSPNRLASGRLPPHTLMPVLVRRDGTLVGAHGTMGGKAQPQIHTQVAMKVEAGLSPGEAVAAPRWVLGATGAGVVDHAPPRSVVAELDVPGVALSDLRRSNFTTTMLPAQDDRVGHFQIVRLVEGELTAASDPRADGCAMLG